MNYLGLKKNELTHTVKELNLLLANYQLYYQNLRNFHWNVEGENFFELHEKFEELYDDARGKIDEIAERILTLRHRPMSRLSDYIDEADVAEAGNITTDRQMVDRVLTDHKILIEKMRQVIEAADAVKDEGTIDMIGGFLADIEKMSWMMDAWRAKKMEPATA